MKYFIAQEINSCNNQNTRVFLISVKKRMQKVSCCFKKLVQKLVQGHCKSRHSLQQNIRCSYSVFCMWGPSHGICVKVKWLLPAWEGEGCTVITSSLPWQPSGAGGLPAALVTQRYCTAAWGGCQAAAAFAKHLVWSCDCSARLFVARSETLSGVGHPLSLLCKSPCLPLAAAGMGSQI